MAETKGIEKIGKKELLGESEISFDPANPDNGIIVKNSSAVTPKKIINLKNYLGTSVFTLDNLGQMNALLPAFDDDTAAGIGGLVLGDIYQTTGNGANPLNVAGIVMVKQ